MSRVITDLATWGPASTTRAPSVAEAERYCRDLATSHYENFTVVSWFLPRELRQHMYNIYAFCRWSDDLGDETGDTAKSTELLEWWQSELDRCFRGDASHPVFVALLTTVRTFELSPDPFIDLIDAFRQDQVVHEYATFEQLEHYCRRSANPVGRIVLALFGESQHFQLVKSDSICTGLQLANFWQDVDRDMKKGRVYLPRVDRLRFGYTDEDLKSRRTTPAFLELMRFEVDRARNYLKAGQNLPQSVRSRRLRLDLELFVAGGLKILDEIESIGYRVWDRRPTVTKAAKLRLLLKSAARAIAPI